MCSESSDGSSGGNGSAEELLGWGGIMGTGPGQAFASVKMTLLQCSHVCVRLCSVQAESPSGVGFSWCEACSALISFIPNASILLCKQGFILHYL